MTNFHFPTRTIRLLAIFCSFSFPLSSPATYGQARMLTLPAGVTYELGFSPGDTALSVVLDSIASAKQTILVAAYEFTSRPILNALIDAARKGIKVAVVADAHESERHYSLVLFLSKAGIPCRVDAAHPITHDKYLVIDRDTAQASVETGSYNFTSQANRNAENSIFIRSVPELAQLYANNWQQLWNESQPIQ